MPRVFRRLLSKDFVARVWARANKDGVFDRSAQLSYYFLLSLFPLLFFLTTLFGYFAGTGSHLQRKLITYLGSVVPASALRLVTATIEEVIAARGSGKLSFGLLAALWAASSGINALGQALNAAYGVPETRPWWKVRLISVALTIALAVLIVSALLIVLYGGRLGEFLFGSFHEGHPFSIVWKILQWPIALAFVFLAFGLIYQFAPNLSERRRGGRLQKSDYRRRSCWEAKLIASWKAETNLQPENWPRANQISTVFLLSHLAVIRFENDAAARSLLIQEQAANSLLPANHLCWHELCSLISAVGLHCSKKGRCKASCGQFW